MPGILDSILGLYPGGTVSPARIQTVTGVAATLEAVFRGARGSDGHIQAQNKAVADMDVALRTMPRTSVAGIDALQTRIRTIADGFARFASQFGLRGSRGAQDVEELARRIVSDLENEKRGGGVPLPQNPPAGGFSVAGLPDWVIPAGIAGVFILLMMRRK